MIRIRVAENFLQETFAMTTQLGQSLTPRKDERRLHRRRGLALLVVLVALGIITAISLTLVEMALLHHRQAEREAFALQARWLAESGYDQAASHLRSDPEFQGAIWNVPAESIDGRHSASVVIDVQPVKDSPHSRVVIVTADFPSDSSVSMRTRTRFQRQVDL
jgi:Tfp pilus assembly protein PilX